MLVCIFLDWGLLALFAQSSTTLLPQAKVLTLVGLALAFVCLDFVKEGYFLVALVFLNTSFPCALKHRDYMLVFWLCFCPGKLLLDVGKLPAPILHVRFCCCSIVFSFF